MINLRQVVAGIPDQFRQQLTIENKDKLKYNPPAIVVCGMGASGKLGYILRALFPHFRIDIQHSYGLPRFFAPESFFLIVSYSGGTEETLSAYQEAREKNLPHVVITSNGKLLEEVKKNGGAYIKIPGNDYIPTRFMVGYLLRGALTIFEQIGIVDSASEQLAPLDKEIITDWKETEKILARDLAEKIVVIYAPPDVRGLGHIWKEALNETAKMPAFLNIIPEMNHNEIESLEALPNKLIFLIKDPREHEQIRRRFQILIDICKEKSWPFREIHLAHPDRIVDMVNTITLALSTSISLAELKKVDPAKTPLIDEIKRRLAGNH